MSLNLDEYSCSATLLKLATRLRKGQRDQRLGISRMHRSEFGSSSTVVFSEGLICPANLSLVVVVDDTPISADSVDLISCCSDFEGAPVFIKATLWHVSCGRSVKLQCLMSTDRFEDTIDVSNTSRRRVSTQGIHQTPTPSSAGVPRSFAPWFEISAVL